MIQKKIQLAEDEWDFISSATEFFNYKSKSQYMREAILEKIKRDQRIIREMKREEAMTSYSGEDPENIFKDLEGEEFEEW
jgi:hypothetical protein